MSAVLDIADSQCASRPRRMRCAASRSPSPRARRIAWWAKSGCGKSLSALAVMGLLPRGAHRGADAHRFRRRRPPPLAERGMARLRGDRMAMIFQEPMTSLNPAYTVGSQMTEVLRRHRGLRQRRGA